MGCGGSIYMEDGSLKAGKGELKWEIAPEEKLEIMYYWPNTHPAKKFGIQTKPADPKKMQDPWTQECEGSKPCIWMSMNPGTVQQRFVIDEARLSSCFVEPLDLTKKIAAAHALAPAVFPALCKATAGGDHPYKSNPDKALADCEELKNCVTPHQIHEDLQPLKKTLITIEDLVPYNVLTANVNPTIDIGFFENKEGATDPRTATGGEKIKLMALIKLHNPHTAKQIKLKTLEVTRQIIEKALDAACAVIKQDRMKLLGPVNDILDEMEGRRPGSTKKPIESGDKPEDKSPDDLETIEQKVIDRQWGDDKMWHDNWISKTNYDQEKKAMEDHAVKSYDELMAAVSKPFDKKVIDNGKVMVLARWKEKKLYEAEASAYNDDGTVTVTWPENKHEQSDWDYVKINETITKKDLFGKESQVERVNIMPLPPHPDPKQINIGDKLRVWHKTGYFYDGVCSLRGENFVDVKDEYNDVEQDVQTERMWVQNNPQDVIKPRLLRRHFYDFNVWWIKAETEPVKIHLWRAGSKKETIRSYDLVSTEGPAKATKAVPNPDYKVFTGFKATVRMMPSRAYAFNFQIGDKYFLDVDTPAPSPEHYRRIWMKFTL